MILDSKERDGTVSDKLRSTRGDGESSKDTGRKSSDGKMSEPSIYHENIDGNTYESAEVPTLQSKAGKGYPLLTSSVEGSPAKTSPKLGSGPASRGHGRRYGGSFTGSSTLFAPRWILVENVPGLLSSHKGRDFALLLASLAELGYGICWRVLDSRHFGVPQRRRRVFIVGHLGASSPEPFLPFLEGGEGNPSEGEEAGKDVAVASLSGLGSGGPDDNDGQGGRFVTGATVRRLTPVECCRLQGFPDDWLDGNKPPDSPKYAALGDAVTVPVAEWIGRRLREVEE